MTNTTEAVRSGDDAPPTTDPPASSSGSKKLFLGAMVFPLFMMLLMPLLYSWGLHSPSPNDMKVAVIGESAQSQQMAGALSARSDGAFAVSTVRDPAAAHDAIDRLEIRGAWDPATNNVYVASAGGLIASTAAEGFLKEVATSQNPGAPPNVIDVVPPTSDDRLANTVLFVGIAAILGGFTLTTVLRMAVGTLSLRVELLLLATIGVALAVIPLFIAYSFYGTFDQGFVKVGLLLYAGVLTVGCFHLGALRLIGPAAVVPTIAIMVLLGIPASGAAVPAEMVPGFFGTLSRILPTPALLDGMRRVVYFPDSGLGATVSTLALWVLVGAAMIGLAALRHTDDPDAGTRHQRGLRHYFGDNHTASPAQMARRKQLIGGGVLPLFLVTALPLLFIGLFHNPTPHDMRVAVVAEDAAAGEKSVAGIQAVSGDSFEFSYVPDAEAAQDELRRLDIRGIYDPESGELTVASAGNAQSTQVVTRTFTEVAAQNGRQLKIDDIAPLPHSDALGSGVLFIGLGAILGGFLSAVVAFLLGGALRRRWHVAAVFTISAITAITQVLISYQWLGILHANEWQVAGVLFLIAVTCGLIQLGGSYLIGPGMLLVSLLVLIFLGVSASGIAVGMDMAPAFYRAVHPVLPTSNGFEGLKRLAYFDGAAVWSNLWVVFAWLAVGVALTVGGWLLRRNQPAPANPMINLDREH